MLYIAVFYVLIIEFATEKTRDSVSYLEALVSRKGRTLETDLYCKSTDIQVFAEELLSSMARQKSNPLWTGS